MAWFNDLPRELMIDIVLRLPVKTLLCFMCVSKSCRSLITDPTVLVMHPQRDGRDSDSYLLCISEEFSGKRYVIRDQTISVKHFVKNELPFNTHSWYCQVVGACYGLVCLSDGHWDKFSHFLYLWNPALRKFKVIQCSCPDHQFIEKEVVNTVLGFGFDHRTNDFLVIRIIYFFNSDQHRYCEEKIPYTEVYSLNTDSWSRVESILPCWSETVLTDKPMAFVNGAVHWNASVKAIGRECDLIGSFDTAERVFKMIKLPRDCFAWFAQLGLLPDCWTPAVFKESLAFIVLGGAEDYHLNRVCYIWIMKEYGVVESWTKQFTIQLDNTVVRPLGFTKNGELLLDDGGELVSWDFDSSKSKKLGFCGNRYSFDVVTCMESLRLLDRENAVLQMA